MSTANLNHSQTERAAVITGSSKGIGKAIALKFASKDYRVVLNSRDEEELSKAANDVKKSLEGNEERVSYLAGDVSHERVCASLIDHTIRTLGRIDALVNNAGIGGAQKKSI